MVGEDLPLVSRLGELTSQCRVTTHEVWQNYKIVVGVAQLVEPRVVIPVVVGSSPIIHPNLPAVFISAAMVGED